MNRMLNIFFIIVIMSSLIFSCDDGFLDRQPYDALSSDIIWTSDKYAIIAVNGIYNALKRNNALGEFFLNYSNLGPCGTTHNGGAIQQGNATTRTVLFRNVYSDFYRIINYSNDAIVNLADNNAISESVANRLSGEAKYLRGLSYFYLWQLFGGVIILEEPILPSEIEKLPRNTAEEVKALIIRDFSDAISLLPEFYSGADIGRATKGAAIAMLGKTYLYDKQWEKATLEFSKLMTSPYIYELHPEYYQVFDFKWQPTNEEIFSLQCVMEPGLGSRYDMRYGGRSAHSWAWNNSLASFVTVSNYTFPDGSAIDFSIIPKRADYSSEYEYGLDLIPWYKSTFSDVDKRVHGNIIMPGFTFIGANNEEFIVNWPFADHMEAKPFRAYATNWTFAALFPWRKFVNVGTENQVKWDSPNDLPIIRYADVLLMFAEAQNEASGVSEEVYNAVNMVRNRAGVADFPPGLTQDQMRRNIWLERLKEFAAEGHLFFDVRRWKTAATNDPVFGLNHDVLDFRGERLYTRVFTERDYLWPIPEQEREINPNLDQNPGW